jgi:hypothetical protein
MKKAAVVLTAVLAATAGCGSDSSGGSVADGATSASPSPSQSVVLPDPEPTVEPATGAEMDVEGITLRLPEKWRVGYDTPFAATAQGPQGSMDLTAIARDQVPLARLMRIDVRATGPLEGVREHAGASLGGFSAYHYTGRPNSVRVRHAYGTWDAGYHVWIHFDLASRIPAEEREALVESVVATYASS